MKIEPCEMGGLIITPENIWEEAYMDSLYQDLHIFDFYMTSFPGVTYQSFILLEKSKREIIY